MSAQNRVLELDGNGSYVELPPNVFTNLTEATIEGWAKWHAFTPWSRLFTFFALMEADYDASTRLIPRAYSSLQIQSPGVSGDLRLEIRDVDQQVKTLLIPSVLKTNTWFHFAAVLGSGGMKMYVNGILLAERDYTGSFAQLGSPNMNYLGRSPHPWDVDFRGQMDDLRIWSVARTSEQIREGMFTAFTGSEPGLAAHWTFDDDTARDRSTNGIHGRLMGNARCVIASAITPELTIQPATVSGRVVAEGGPRDLAFVQLRLMQEGKEVARQQSGNFGIFSIDVLMPNDKPYDLIASFGARVIHRPGLRLNAGTRLNLRLDSSDPSSISGIVRAMNGAPQAEVVVQVIDRANQIVGGARTSEAGAFTITNLPPSDYLVRCHVVGAFYYHGRATSVLAPIEDSTKVAGAKWVTTQPGEQIRDVDLQIAPFRKGTWRKFTHHEGLPFHEIHTLYFDAAGFLWVGGSGLARFDGKTFVDFTPRGGPLRDGIYSILDDGKWLWLGLRNSIARFNPVTREVQELAIPSKLSYPGVRQMVKDPQGNLWFLATSGVCQFDGQKIQFTSFNEIGFAQRDRTEPPLRKVAVSGAGDVWFAGGGGVARYANGKFELVSTPEPFQSVFSVTMNEGDRAVCFGNNTGVWSYSRNEFACLASLGPGVNTEIESAFAEAGGGFWVSGGPGWYNTVGGLGPELWFAK
ncbi:MAG: LamG-like jellyroll fold domain-containing protein, partial [Verrucomicrobiota bacterium]